MYWIVSIFSILAIAEASLRKPFFGFGGNECILESSTITTDNTSCGVRPSSCPDSYYRTIDASCNNLEHGWWGTPLTPYKRLVNNNYFDGVHEFPKSKKKKDLPNPREISLKLFSPFNKDDKRWTLGFMQYGQIISHDLSLTAKVLQAPACCSQGQLTPEVLTFPRCAPIMIPKDDPYNTPAGRICMNFVRTEATKDRTDCVDTTTVSEPLTEATSLLDSSFIYGSDLETSLSLREREGGRLRFEEREGLHFLPRAPDATQACNLKFPTEPCYVAGDGRVNQNPQLALLQNVYMLHHNNIANELSQLNPQWDDETIFQETRKIVIAIHQNIFYYEMLVFILDLPTLIKENIVHIGENGYINDYDPTVNPAVTNEFATAAFRFFHTQIQGDLRIFNESRAVVDYIRLKDWFLRPGIIEYADNFRGLCRGLTTEPQSALDPYFADDILNFLFQDGILGSDLKATDIIRGRDHGLASYAQLMEKCCLGKPKSFRDFYKFMKNKDVRILSSIYESPEDVDAIVGMSLENPLPGALCGPVTCCILADQASRTRKGDRYFFENNQHPGAFTLEQLNSIRKITFANLMCQVPGITYMQQKAFELVSPINPLIPCSEIPKLNISLWQVKLD